jgi:ABC-type transport system involved in cytochrome c biogenesis permease subunit
VAVTLGLIVASVYASARWGVSWIVDPTIALAFVTWAIYVAMLFSRLAIGWRGRKSAYFAIAGFCGAALTWIVNNGAHTFMRR